MARICSAVFLLLLAGTPAATQTRPTPNTLALAPGQAGPRATLADVAWLAGHWQGPALGGLSEEVWTAPLGGSMMGSYKLVRGDSIIFYEILALVEADSSLVMRLKHFNADLTGWEEKAEVRSFPLVRITPTEAWFEGMTIRRLDADHLQVQLAIRMRDGSFREEEFRYQRVKPALTTVTTASGLRYEIVAFGNGAAARPGHSVRIHETATLADGTVVYSSRANGTPVRFRLGGNQVIAGVEEGVTGMRVGERRRLVVPPSLSVRSVYPPNTPPDATLYIDVELVEISEAR